MGCVVLYEKVPKRADYTDFVDRLEMRKTGIRIDQDWP